MWYVRKIGSSRFPIWGEKRPVLAHLDLELTERCNNDCVHCYINLPAADRSASRRELDRAAIGDVLKQAAELGCLDVRLTGGEPLLRPDFESVYLDARRLGLRVTLFTNAVLLTPAVASLFARVPPLAKVEVTIYGLGRETYEAVSRTPGSFAAAVAGVERLREARIPFAIKGAMLPGNLADWPRFDDWVSRMTGDPEPAGSVVALSLRARRDDPARAEEIRGLRFPPERMARLAAAREASFFDDAVKLFGLMPGAPDARLFSCGAGDGICAVDSYGAAQMCLTLRHPETVYDLKRGSLRDAMENFFPAVRLRTAENPEYLRRCARCFLRPICDQCPAQSWMEHGTLDTPVEYLCDIAHAQARRMGLLAGGEKSWEIDNAAARLAGFREARAKRSPK